MKAHNTLLALSSALLMLVSMFVLAEGCQDCPDKKQCNCFEWGTGIYLPRPQTEFWPAFFDPYLYTCCRPCDRGHAFFAGYRYAESMKNNYIARCLFGADVLRLSGSEVPVREEGDWLADNFGLAPNFTGQIYFDPSIKNHMFDLSLRLEFGNWAPCLDRLYLNLFTTLVYSRWSLGSCPVQQTPLVNEHNAQYSSFPPCYMSKDQAPSAKDLETAFSGDYLFGDMQTKWHYNQILLNRTFKAVNFADIHMMLGYDFFQKSWGHFGAFLMAVAPTGNHPSPSKVFEPIIGNGHHWEIGGGIDGHFNLWKCNDKCLQFFLNAYATHVCNSTQMRTFDLQPGQNGAPGVGSRFLLLKEFDNNNLYTGNLINALNFTTREIKSSFALQGEVTTQLLFRWCNWTLGAGYNMYARSSENISQSANPCREYEGKHFGVKGTSGVCTFDWVEGQPYAGNPCPKGYHATETLATRMTNSTPPNNTSNQSVDNAQLQQIINANPPEVCITWNSPTTGAATTDVITAYDSLISEDGAFTSAPIFVGPNASMQATSTDIDYKPIQRQIAHSFFAHINYEFNDDCRCFQPFLGLGGSVEFAQQAQCKVCGTNQWSIWLNGGINF